MAITNKTRKLLWGRSGNRCAICKNQLIIEATSTDDASVVGEECHINSGQVNGPRYDASIPPDKIDIYENLLLLCKVHHKMVDDQYETYSVDILKQIKSNHEKWVSEKLSKDKNNKDTIKIKRLKSNIPKHLTRICTGRELSNIISDTCGFYFEHDELETEEELEIISCFLQSVQDYVDIYSDLEVGAKIKASFDMNSAIKNVENTGFYIFGAKENQIIEGGIDNPASWPVFHIRIIRKTNEAIIR